MKRIAIAFCLLWLFLSLPVQAQEYDYCAGAAAGPVYTDCSNIGTAAFYWNGDHASGTEYGCKSSSTSLNGAKSGATVVASGTDPGTASPTSAGNVAKATAGSQYIRWAITTKDIFDSAEGRITVDVYLAASTNTNYIFRILVDASNYFRAYINSGGQVVVQHNGNATQVTMTSTATISDATWTTVQFRWSATNNKISVKVGEAAWEDDADADAVTAFTAEPGYLNFLNDAIADSTYIDNIFVWKTSGL